MAPPVATIPEAEVSPSAITFPGKVLSAFMTQHRARQSAFVTWRRNQGKQFFRLGCFQDSERYRRAAHIAKAARRCRNMLALAGPAAEGASEFVVSSAISSLHRALRSFLDGC
jgi:hypothetical protein